MSSVPCLSAAPESTVERVIEPTVPLFGLDITAVPFATALEVLADAASRRDGRASIAVTPNVDHLVRLDTQPAFKHLYGTADYIFADGMPVVWASRAFGTPLPERVTGADLAPALCERARASGLRVVVIGGLPGHEASLIEGIAAHYPGLDFEVITPSMSFDPLGEEGKAAADRVREVTPDIVFVCLGMPKQERWAFHYASSFPGGLILCAGAAMEFAAGLRKRAPHWMQRVGLEWSWRLMQDPARLWRRYLLEDTRFLAICWRYWRGMRSTTPTRTV
jgi:N-acetylglucosaminyldiphosphoundecaprenol N-acetyl-beta-D-mannosaminyltransferase